MAKETTNFIITRGKLVDQLKYSLFKLLDWSVGNAVHVALVPEGYILINDCPRELRTTLMEKIGGTTLQRSWMAEKDTDIYEVLRIVTEWVNRD